MNLFEEIVRLSKENETFAVATILESKGSTPRHLGKMIVKRDGSILGTVGGGLAEAMVIGEAKKAIARGQSTIVDYTLNSEAQGGLNMLCGGSMKVFVEVVEARPKLMIIGAGHVGKALATLADFLSFRVIVVDEREEFASAAVYPMAAEIYSDEEITLAIGQAQIDPDTYIAIATKDSDERCLRKVIGSGAAYIGMIGSGRKVLKVLQRLNADGVPEALTRAVNAPVGLDIGAETPEEIAVSIMAEILRVRNNATGKSLREVKLGAQE